MSRQQQNPMTLNGGSIVAMTGKNCVAMACDKRMGMQYTTVTDNFQRVFKMQHNILMGIGGFGTDVITL